MTNNGADCALYDTGEARKLLTAKGVRLRKRENCGFDIERAKFSGSGGLCAFLFLCEAIFTTNGMTDYRLDCEKSATIFAELKKRGSVTALGAFDGIHRGHSSLLRKTRELSDAAGLANTVWTFCKSDFFRKNGESSDRRLEYITTDPEKLAALSFYGSDYVSMNAFENVRGLDCRQFVRDRLVSELGTKIAVCGEDFRFGFGGLGNAETLQKLMRQYGGDCVICESVRSDEIQRSNEVRETVSSTRIRELIKSGDTPFAAKLLGRPFALFAEVGHGRQLGRTLGIPTLNMRFPDGGVIPRFGVYETICVFDSGEGLEVRPSITNVGMRPTVAGLAGGDSCPVGETHLLDFGGDLYGKKAAVAFGKFVRPETRFDSVDSLKKQMETDIEVRRKSAPFFD